MENANFAKLADLIREIEVAMLTTIDSNGILHSRPMVTQKTSFDGSLWFFTGAGSPKISELIQDGRVNLSYVAPKNDLYVSVSGHAQLVKDRKKAQELWNPAYSTWFPQGLEDPNLALLQVSVEKAECWETRSGSVVQLVGFGPGRLAAVV